MHPNVWILSEFLILHKGNPLVDRFGCNISLPPDIKVKIPRCGVVYQQIDFFAPLQMVPVCCGNMDKGPEVTLFPAASPIDVVSETHDAVGKVSDNDYSPDFGPIAERQRIGVNLTVDVRRNHILVLGFPEKQARFQLLFTAFPC